MDSLVSGELFSPAASPAANNVPNNGTAAAAGRGNESERRAAAAAAPPLPSFFVGQLVSVASRTWPGINQPGGIGRVTGASASAVAVRYVLDGRREKEIEFRYVKPHALVKSGSLRDRTMLLGRCSHCGSLRTDCGSCDVWVQEEASDPRRIRRRRRQQERRRPIEATVSTLEALAGSDDDDGGSRSNSSTDSDDSVTLEDLLHKHRREFQRYKRMQARANRIFASVDGLFTADTGPSKRNKATTKQKKEGRSALMPKISSHKPPDGPRFKTDEVTRDSPVFAGNKGGSSSSSPVSDDSADSFDDLRLQQLVFQSSSSQVGASPDQVRLRMIRRGGRAVLDDSSSSENSVERVDLTNKSQARAKDPSDADYVSNPGTPDHDSPSREITDFPVNAAPAQSSAAIHHDDDDFGYNSGGGTFFDDDEGSFIQPEGNGERLPQDVQDATNSMSYPQLAPFFDETLRRFEEEHVPLFKSRLTQLQRKWEEIEKSTVESSELMGSSNNAAIRQKRTEVKADR
jgi:hypothetical protein